MRDDHLTHIRRTAERQAILEALRRSRWKPQHAATLLGISASTLYRRMQSLSIQRVYDVVLGEGRKGDPDARTDAD